MKDPLDHKIDALLKSHPLRPSQGFTTRVLEANEHSVAKSSRSLASTLIIAALPIAAAIALAFNLLQPGQGANPNEPEELSLSIAEVEEIFFLEESLRELEITESPSFAGQDLLATLDALYLEI
tara:strand:- start:46 stop:417 length:372 start_codon:yes stop_codon:yes gene_type:complete